MSVSRLDVNGTLPADIRAYIQLAMDIWTEQLDMEPHIMIGRHLSTGGLLVIPIQDPDMTTEELLRGLRSTIEYIEKARDNV